jgi:hypothetical protein
VAMEERRGECCWVVLILGFKLLFVFGFYLLGVSSWEVPSLVWSLLTGLLEATILLGV